MSDQSQPARRIDVDLSLLLGVQMGDAAVARVTVGTKPGGRQPVTVGTKPVISRSATVGTKPTVRRAVTVGSKPPPVRA